MFALDRSRKQEARFLEDFKLRGECEERRCHLLNDGGTTEGIPTSTTSVCYTRPEEIPATTTLATTTTSVSTTSPEIDFGNLPAEIGGFNLLFVGTALLAGTLA